MITQKPEIKSASSKKGRQVLTPEFRVSYASVFEARKVDANDPTQTAKFSLVMLFPKKTDLSALRLIAQEAAVERWGADKTKWPKGLRSPFRDGSEKDSDGYGPEIIFCSASSKQRPGVVGPDVQPVMDASEFYSGCYARATITAFAYEVKGNRGVSFGLRNVQKLRDGEPFSGRNKPEADFDSIAVPEDTVVDVPETKSKLGNTDGLFGL